MYVSSSLGQLTDNSSGMLSSMWILDSDASHHMSPNSSCFASMSLSSSIHVMTIDGTPMPLTGVGPNVTQISLSLSLSLMFIIFRNSH